MNETISFGADALDRLVPIPLDLGQEAPVLVLTRAHVQGHVHGQDHDLEAELQDLGHQDPELRERGLEHEQGRGHGLDHLRSAGR